MKIIIILTLILCFSFVVRAQDENKTKGKLMTDRWRGLIIDESTPEDAFKTIGLPDKDKKGKVLVYPLNSRLTFGKDTKGLRRLEYKKLEGIKKAILLFKDDKLILIELQYKKKIIASAFPTLYDTEFTTEISDIFFGKNVERDKGQESKKSYLSFYYLIATTDKTYVSAAIENGGIKNSLFDMLYNKINDDNKDAFPGTASRIQIISRKTEKSEAVAISNAPSSSPD